MANLGLNFAEANLAMQLAPDGKIYIRNNMGKVLNAIHYPNNAGIACGFSLDSFTTTSVIPMGLPTFNQSYFHSGILAEHQCFGTVLFSLLRIHGAETVTWDFGDPASPDNISLSPLHTFTAAGTYTVTATIVSNGGPQTATATITVEDPYEGLTVPNNIAACAAQQSVTFNLTAQTGIILGSLNPQDYAVTYYTSYENAQLGTDAIAQPQAFISSGQTMYVRVVNFVTNCTLVLDFSLVTVPVPAVPALPQLETCNSSAQATFNLRTHENLITNLQDVSVAYYTSTQDAAAGTNAIATPESYTNTSNPQTIYVGVTNNAGCVTVSSFQLVVHPTPALVSLPGLGTCGTNNTATFNLTVYENELLTLGATGITYHTSPEDAEQGTGAITVPELYTNSTSPQTLYIRLSNAHCATVLPLQITVIDSPVPASLEFTLCPPVNLQLLVNHDEGEVQFYTSEEDAFNAENAISQSDNFDFNQDTELFYTVTNAAGCRGIAALNLVKGFCDIPEGISPNNDLVNDELDLSLLNIAGLHIFNRYGLEVYKQSPYSKQWHGQDSQGNELPVGTYFYRADFNDGTNKTGWIYLNR